MPLFNPLQATAKSLCTNTHRRAHASLQREEVSLVEGCGGGEEKGVALRLIPCEVLSSKPKRQHSLLTESVSSNNLVTS